MHQEVTMASLSSDDHSKPLTMDASPGHETETYPLPRVSTWSKKWF